MVVKTCLSFFWYTKVEGFSETKALSGEGKSGNMQQDQSRSQPIISFREIFNVGQGRASLFAVRIFINAIVASGMSPVVTRVWSLITMSSSCLTRKDEKF